LLAAALLLLLLLLLLLPLLLLLLMHGVTARRCSSIQGPFCVSGGVCGTSNLVRSSGCRHPI